MHRVAYGELKEKSLKSIFSLFTQVLWFNFFFPKLKRYHFERKSLAPEVQKLGDLARTLQAEKEILEAELQATPYIKGSLGEYHQKDKNNPERVRTYHVLRWQTDGKVYAKHIVKKKRKEGDLTLPEAQELVGNASKAKRLSNEIKERSHRLHIIKDKLSILTGKVIDVNKPISKSLKGCFHGRQNEFEKLEYNVLYKIPTLILGEPGIGKTSLVNQVASQVEKKLLRVPSLRAPKATLLENIIAKLHKNRDLKINRDNYSYGLEFEELKKLLRSKTVVDLASIISDSVFSSNYLIIFDSLAGLTQTNKIVLEKLFETGCPILACSNQIKKSIEFESLYRKFSLLELEAMKDKELEKVVWDKLENINCGNWGQFFKTKILNTACGNPGIVEKMCKEAQAMSFGGELSYSQLEAIEEPYLERKYFDLTPFVIFGIACFGILRFIGIGTNDTLLYVIGGSCFLIFMAFGRLLMTGASRR